MKEPIQKYFKVGIIAASSFDVQYGTSPESVVKIIACDPYFDVIELNPLNKDGIHEGIINTIAQSYMDVCYGAQGKLLGAGLSLADVSEKGRLAAVAAVRSGIDEANMLGAKRVAFLAGKWEQDKREENYRQLVRSIEELCSYAMQYCISLELEVFDYDMDKASLIGPAPLAARLAAEIRYKYNNFGILVDLSHFPTTYEDSRFVLRTLRPYITHFHFGNAVVQPGAPAYGDQHPRFGFPNSAHDTMDLLEYLLILKEEGFFVKNDPMILSMEVKPWRGEGASIILSNTKRVLNRAWAML